MPYLLLIMAFAVNGLATVFLKLNALRGAGFSGGVSIETITGNAYLFSALALFGTNIILYYLALRSVPLAIAYPIMVTGTFLVVGLASLLIFHEHISGPQVAGYLLVLTGITLVSVFS
jgi:multidrug transporter EmrE-like cation transporter